MRGGGCQRAGRRWLALMAGVVLLGGCGRITHASDFEVTTEPSPTGLCARCEQSDEDLLHPPCPTSAGADVPDTGEMYVFVWRRYELGFDSDQWEGPNREAFRIGMDLDCSDRRPTGEPALCDARSLEDGGTGEPWSPLPHGIDNALSQRVFAPLTRIARSMGQKVDLEQGINQSIAKGGNTIMTVVENWNGTPNDPKVTARIVSVAGISKDNGGPPRWDGDDLWNALSDGPDPTSPLGAPDTMFKTDDAYVTKGVLVLDLSFLGVAPLVVVNNGSRLDMALRDFVLIGQISPGALQNINVSGRWAYSDLIRANVDVAEFLSGCDPAKKAFLLHIWPSLLETAPDLPVDLDNPAPGPCEFVSVGFGAEAVRARLGGYRPVSTLPGGCPPP